MINYILKIRKSHLSISRLRKLCERYGTIIKVAFINHDHYFAPFLNSFIEKEKVELSSSGFYYVQYSKIEEAKNANLCLNTYHYNSEFVSKFPDDFQIDWEKSKENTKQPITLPDYMTENKRNNNKYINTLVMYAIYKLGDRTGSSKLAIEKYLNCHFSEIFNKKEKIKLAIHDCLKKGLIKTHSLHQMSYMLPNIAERKKNSIFKDYKYNMFV